METLISAKSDWCNFRERRSARACKTSDISTQEGVVSLDTLAVGGAAVSLSPEAQDWASEDRRRWSKAPAGMAS
jgi:hypothetical protein